VIENRNSQGGLPAIFPVKKVIEILLHRRKINNSFAKFNLSMDENYLRFVLPLYNMCALAAEGVEL
jgi:hypothetical protein